MKSEEIEITDAVKLEEVGGKGSGVWVYYPKNLMQSRLFPSLLASLKEEHPELQVTAISPILTNHSSSVHTSCDSSVVQATVLEGYLVNTEEKVKWGGSDLMR